MFEVDALIHYDNRLFLAQTLEHGQETGRISPEHADKIHQDIAAIDPSVID